MAVRATGDTANSYITQATAEAYWVDQWEQGELEDNHSIDDIEGALVTATNLMEQLPWDGLTSVADQPLAWPRDMSIPRTRRGNNTGRTITLDAETPARVGRAQAELAFHLLSNPGIATDTGGLLTNASLVAGSIELNGLRGASLIPSRVRRELDRYMKTGANSAVFVGS